MVSSKKVEIITNHTKNLESTTPEAGIARVPRS